MENTLQPIALIIGDSSGIGLESAKLLLKRNVKTVIVGRKQTKLNKVHKELSEFTHSNNLPIKYLLSSAGYIKPTPFMDHENKDYDFRIIY